MAFLVVNINILNFSLKNKSDWGSIEGQLRVNGWLNLVDFSSRSGLTQRHYSNPLSGYGKIPYWKSLGKLNIWPSAKNLNSHLTILKELQI